MKITSYPWLSLIVFIMAINEVFRKVKTFFLGGARDFRERSIFHQLALSAFLAWVGLGSDGLSSSCYGPPEAFKALQGHPLHWGFL